MINNEKRKTECIKMYKENDSQNVISDDDLGVEIDEDEAKNVVYCLCKKSENDDESEQVMIECEYCNDWFHIG